MKNRNSGKGSIVTAAEFRENRRRSEGKKTFVDGESRGAESLLQEKCVNWFRLRYRVHAKQLFSVPNGGFRTPKAGSIMKKEGMLRGVSDLILLHSARGFHGICIEFKVSNNSLSVEQLDFGTVVSEAGYLFKVVRNYDDFMELVNWYFVP